jgi:hypothetical protein
VVLLTDSTDRLLLPCRGAACGKTFQATHRTFLARLNQASQEGRKTLLL